VQNVRAAGVALFAFDQFNLDHITVSLTIYPYQGYSYNEIYESYDCGNTWNQIYEFPDLNLTSHPTNSNIKYKISDSKFYKSTDGGNTWVEKLALPNWFGRIAVSPDEPDYVYVLAQGPSLYKSSNAGETFQQYSIANVLGSCNGGPTPPAQSGIIMFVANPMDANELYVGNFITWHSTDGGITWYSLPCNDLTLEKRTHVDKHFLGFQPVSNLFFEGNDGGVTTSSDGVYWTGLDNGLQISQIYRIGTSRTNPNLMMYGMQDNGTVRYNSSLNKWVRVGGSDGMDCAIFPLNNNIQYLGEQYGVFYRTTNNWATHINIKNNFPSSFQGSWLSPLLLDSQNANTFYILGMNQLIKTTNGGNSFTVISDNCDEYTSIAISYSNPNILYFKKDDNTGQHFYKTYNGGQTWTDIYDNFTFASFVDIYQILIKDTDPNTVACCRLACQRSTFN
jgi:photosystem II stability/assembly factor-like uncharacterized protein